MRSSGRPMSRLFVAVLPAILAFLWCGEEEGEAGAPRPPSISLHSPGDYALVTSLPVVVRGTVHGQVGRVRLLVRGTMVAEKSGSGGGEEFAFRVDALEEGLSEVKATAEGGGGTDSDAMLILYTTDASATFALVFHPASFNPLEYSLDAGLWVFATDEEFPARRFDLSVIESPAWFRFLDVPGPADARRDEALRWELTGEPVPGTHLVRVMATAPGGETHTADLMLVVPGTAPSTQAPPVGPTADEPGG